MLEAFEHGFRDGKTVGRFQERRGIKKGITIRKKLLRRGRIYMTNFKEETAYILGHVIGELPYAFKFILKDIARREKYPTKITIIVDNNGKPKV